MAKSVQDMVDEYAKKFGHIPDTKAERLAYIKQQYKIDDKKIRTAMDEIASIKDNYLNFTIPLIPTPSPRPRYSFKTKHFYVSGAGDMHKYMDQFMEDNELLVEYISPDPEEFSEFVRSVAGHIGIICTRTTLNLTTYQPVPTSSQSPIEIYLAEMGVIRPIQNPDWDNLGKTYCDMIQGRLLLNDNIVARGVVEKYWSIKPRIEIELTYQNQFDCKFNYNKIINSTAYKKYVSQFGIQVA